MNCFTKHFLKSKEVTLLNRCIVLNQSYYHSNPPIILAIRKDTYVVLNVAMQPSLFEVPKSSVKVPIECQGDPVVFSKGLQNKLVEILSKKEFEELWRTVECQ